MKRTRNSLTLLLMISSIVLLLVLQVFWLTNSYETAYFDLRKETNTAFRSTIGVLRDSILLRKIEYIVMSDDSSSRDRRTYFSRDRLEGINPSRIQRLEIKKDSGKVRIYLSANQNKDSIHAVMRPFMNRMYAANVQRDHMFSFRNHPDTLSTDSLRKYFQRALTAADIEAGFIIKHLSLLPRAPLELHDGRGFGKPPEEIMDEQTEKSVFSDSLYSDWVRFDPASRYAAVLSSFRPSLIQEILPQIFFSLFLTLITITSFVLLYRSIRTQQRLMEIKNDFISNMTHELKTPIATVSVALEALKNFSGMDNPRLTAEYLDIAQHELNRLTLLTDKVLKTSLFEEQGISFVPETVDMDKTILQVFNSMKLVFEKNKAAMSYTKQGNDFTIKGGSIHLTNVIYNLLDNALKYSKDSLAINVTLKDKEDKLILSVQDNGIGIAPEYKGKIFEKFFRVPTGDVHTTKGYGLGLNYVDNVIRSHHGKIEVESKPGEGSTFIITLPRNANRL